MVELLRVPGQMTAVVHEDGAMSEFLRQLPTSGPDGVSAELAGMTRELVHCFRSAFEQANLDSSVDCPPLRQLVYVDVDMWRQIVQKLLCNDLKLTFRSRIVTSLAMHDGLAELRLKDSGVRISAEQIPRLFDRLSRPKGVTGRSQKRTGIELVLVADRVQLYGGTISVESIVGVGKSFIVRIPSGTAQSAERLVPVSFANNSTIHRSKYAVGEAMRLLSAEDATALEKLRETAVEREPSGSEVRGVKPRVVIAGNRTETMEYLRMLLSEDYVVEMASDELPALDLVRKSPPNLLLIDNIMSQVDGIELLWQIRADRQTVMLPVVMLSLKTPAEKFAVALEVGADEILIEPFSDRELLDCISAHLKIGRLRRSMDEAAPEVRGTVRGIGTRQLRSCLSDRCRLEGSEFFERKGLPCRTTGAESFLAGSLYPSQPTTSGPEGDCSSDHQPGFFRTGVPGGAKGRQHRLGTFSSDCDPRPAGWYF